MPCLYLHISEKHFFLLADWQNFKSVIIFLLVRLQKRQLSYIAFVSEKRYNIIKNMKYLSKLFTKPFNIWLDNPASGIYTLSRPVYVCNDMWTKSSYWVQLDSTVSQKHSVVKEWETFNEVTEGIRGPTPPRGEGVQIDLKSALLYFLRLACTCLQEHSRPGGLQW